MKRLLQICFDTLLISILPILMWILLGFIVTKDISNVFSLTYPLQFFFMFFESLFSKGPNVVAKKINQKAVIDSNIVFGTVLVGILTIVLCINVDWYIGFLGMDASLYHNYCLYSVLFLYLSYVIQLILQKLYFNNENGRANKITSFFNITNFLAIICLSMLIRQEAAIGITLLIDLFIVTMVFVKNVRVDNFSIKVRESIKFSSFNLLRNISMLLIYVVGFRRSFVFGAIYVTTINFESLTTDAQWDMLYSIDTVSKIDFAENKFDYKTSLKNAYKLIVLLIMSSILLNVALFWYFKPDLGVLLILLAVQYIDMLLDPLKTLRLNYLQIQDNSVKHNIFYVFNRIVRFGCSFIPSVFCTYIAQAVSIVMLLTYSLYQCRNVEVFKLFKKGEITP